jgi:hypothetical protein
MKPEPTITVRQQNLLNRIKTSIQGIPSNDDLHAAFPAHQADRIAQRLQVALGQLELAKAMMTEGD